MAPVDPLEDTASEATSPSATPTHHAGGRVNDDSGPIGEVSSSDDALPQDVQMEGEERQTPDDRIMVNASPEDADSTAVAPDSLDEQMRDADEGDVEPDAEGVAASPDEGKRVKVYELRESSWFDRGTGHCRGVYDDSQDVALIIVEAEDHSAEKGDADEGPGGFLKDELLLTTKVEKDDIYARQQETLIVWTEPTTNVDIALSFQDGDGCEDIWQFICEVQKHLNNLPTDADQPSVVSSSSPLSASPLLGIQGSATAVTEDRGRWVAPSLGNIREHLQLLRIQSRSPQGRERAVEHILAEDYIKNLISVFEQAEDLESVEDLHTLCTLMQAIIMFNDNGILEYILQDGVFQGVIGMLEYDPEFPSLKASFRQFFREIAKFRQVVDLRDVVIKNKIHQTYRLQYLKEVVLARLLDDPTFGILNGFIFFNQVDIIAYFQSNPGLIWEIFDVFKGETASSEGRVDKQKDTVAFLHQLMLMGKTTQIPTRLALYRNLLSKGLLVALEWALRRPEPAVLHAGAEMLTLMAEHDASAVRNAVMEEYKDHRPTLVQEMVEVMTTTENLGLLSQLSDTLKTLIEVPAETESFVQKADGRTNEKFLTYVYEQCFLPLFKPLVDLPEIKFKMEPPLVLSRPRVALLGHLVELLSFCIIAHSHRASLFVMSNPIAKKAVSLLCLKEKPLRHAALRFIKACFRSSNHFMNRHYVKSDLLSPMISLMEEESARDNMLSSACMDILEVMRKDTTAKPVIIHLFETHRSRLDALAERPFFRASLHALYVKYDQWSQPPPPPPPALEAESSTAKASHEKEKQEEDYFNGSDDESEWVSTPSRRSGKVRDRKHRGQEPDAHRIPIRRSPKRARLESIATGITTAAEGGALGLDYDDNSDSDGSTGGSSPRAGPSTATSPTTSTGTSSRKLPPDSLASTEELAEDLGDVALKMRQKRQRDEEDEEGFAGLLKKASAAGAAGTGTGDNVVKAEQASDAGSGGGGGGGAGGMSPGRWLLRQKDKDKDRDRDRDKDKKDAPSVKVKEEGGKKIRLNLGVKKLGGFLARGGGGGSGSAGLGADAGVKAEGAESEPAPAGAVVEERGKTS